MSRTAAVLTGLAAGAVVAILVFAGSRQENLVRPGPSPWAGQWVEGTAARDQPTTGPGAPSRSDADIDDTTFNAALLIHQSPSPYGYGFDPVALIRAVNGLRALGRDRALRALTAFSEQLWCDPEHAARQGINPNKVFVLLPLLFEIEERNSAYPCPSFGGSTTLALTQEDACWRHFPLTVIDDIPFMLVDDYCGSYPGNDPRGAVAYCRKHGTFQTLPFAPRCSPIEAVERLVHSRKWKELIASSEGNREKEREAIASLRMQALRALPALLPEPIPFDWFLYPQTMSPEAIEDEWCRWTSAIHRLRPVWDSDREAFLPSPATR
jgi:hypothetical protein